MRLPDLFGHVVELLEVLLAEPHLLAPALVVDRQDRLEVLGRDVDAVEVELLGGRDDADRGLAPRDLAGLELQEPQQRPQVVAVAGPQVVAVARIALEPVDVGEDRQVLGRPDDVELVLRVVTLGVRHEGADRHRVVAQLPSLPSAADVASAPSVRPS